MDDMPAKKGVNIKMGTVVAKQAIWEVGFPAQARAHWGTATLEELTALGDLLNVGREQKENLKKLK